MPNSKSSMADSAVDLPGLIRPEHDVDVGIARRQCEMGIGETAIT